MVASCDLGTWTNRPLCCAGSAQGLGLGILRSLAGAGANVVMHGLAAEELLHSRTKDIEAEFGVKTAISTADMTKPAEIRSAGANFNHRLCNHRIRHNVCLVPAISIRSQRNSGTSIRKK